MATGRAGTHSSVIDAAEPLVALLEKHGRVSRGMIAARVGAGGHTIKVQRLGGGLRVTVVAKGAKQEFHVYGIDSAQIVQLIAEEKALRNFLVRVANA